MAAKQKKPGMLKRLFSSKKLDTSGLEQEQKKFVRSKSMDAAVMRRQRAVSDSDYGDELEKEKEASTSKGGPSKRSQNKAKQNGAKPSRATSSSHSYDHPKGTRRKGKKQTQTGINMAVPLTYPCTPELILEHHKHTPFLNPTEEMLVVEFNEFECLIESYEMLKIMAKHSKFFEVEPDELVEEFFEFVEEVPSYDEMVNFDVWQEFRDKKYLC